MQKLLVSVRGKNEAIDATKGGANILGAKDPISVYGISHPLMFLENRRSIYKNRRKKFIKNNTIKFLFIFAIIALTGCSSYAIFNQRAYEQDVSIKVDALALMDKADQPYKNYADKVEQLELNIEKAYQYAKGLPNNDETMKQWAIIKDPKEASIISFLERWKNESKLHRAFIEDAKKEVAKQFDQIIELESGKQK